MQAVTKSSAAEKFRRLVDWFRPLDGVVVAFSGGVDSTLVALAAVATLGKKALAVTQVSATFSEQDLRDAVQIALEIGINHVLVGSPDDLDPLVAANTPARCYFCRSNLAEVLLDLAGKHNITTIVDGTNLDDLDDHRPGVLALRAIGVRSPLVELGFNKSDIREVARALGLPNAERPSNACLASRIPHWTSLDRNLLRLVDSAENLVKKLTSAKQVRVRVHGNIARIEVATDERKLFFDEAIIDAVSRALMKLGFSFVTLDLSGYRQGSMSMAARRTTGLGHGSKAP